jgi:hypothetical protein
VEWVRFLHLYRATIAISNISLYAAICRQDNECLILYAYDPSMGPIIQIYMGVLMRE